MIRSKHSFAFLTLLLIGGAIAACGGSQAPATTAAPTEAPATSAAPEPAPPPAETAPGPSAAASGAAEAAPSASAAPAQPSFDQMSEDQKKELMKTVILPHMKEKFIAVNAKRYEKMNCVTCHGAGAKEGKFKMPNPGLPKLDPKDEFAKHKKKTPEVVKFMMETVVPEMSKMLGMQPYDPATKQGFGCFDCHTKA